MKFEMIIFDLDGTLWETEECTCKSANEILKKHNINEIITSETVGSAMGSNFVECAEIYMPYLDKEKREGLLYEMLDLNNSNLQKYGGNLYPNLEETLKQLKEKYKLAIVSNCEGGYIEAFLDSSGLGEYFIDFMAASKMKITKAEAIKRVIDSNEINKAIYVGDTNKDFEASRGAGIEFIYAKYGFGKGIDAKYGINSIVELPEMLEKIEHENI